METEFEYPNPKIRTKNFTKRVRATEKWKDFPYENFICCTVVWCFSFGKNEIITWLKQEKRAKTETLMFW